MPDTLYQPGQAVMIRHSAYFPDQWVIGIVTRATDPQYGWTGATGRVDQSSTTSRAPGWEPEHIRLATEADMADLPWEARAWIDLQLLDFHNPKVPGSTRAVRIALRDAGIERLQDLQRVTDTDLKALKGVGLKAISALRDWQRTKETKLQEGLANV
jgi:hypothetical protein